jgi:hypothetical protein
MRVDAGSGEDTRGVLGELAAHPSPIEADRDPGLRAVGDRLLQMFGEPPRRAEDDGPIHPVGASADDPAKARGAELEGSGEAIREIGLREVGSREKPFDFSPRRGIGVVFGPGTRPRDKIRRGGRHDPGLPHDIGESGVPFHRAWRFSENVRHLARLVRLATSWSVNVT